MSQETVDEKRGRERGRELEKLLLETIAKFTEEERERIFALIGEKFCLHCGAARTARHPICHCRNDE